MNDWREKWYAGKPMAMNMEMPGMSEGMKMMMGDGMKKFEAATGKDFDLMFLEYDDAAPPGRDHDGKRSFD